MPLRQTNEDLFEDSRMSFGEHLEELRHVIVKSLYGLVVGCIFGFLMANSVVKFLQRPLNEAIGDFKIAQAENRLKEENQGFVPPELRQRMKSERLIPKSYKLDPRELVKAIRPFFNPDALEVVDLTPYRFTSVEFKEGLAGDLVSRWLESTEGSVAEGDEASQKMKLLWSLLTETQRNSLRASIMPEVPENEQVSVLMDVFNELIENAAIHEAEEFAEDISEDAGSWLNVFSGEPDDTLFQMKNKLDESDDPLPDLSRRLNHVLISTVFEEQLEPPTVPVTTVQMWEPAEVNPQSLAAPEVFMIWVKAGLFTGLFIASPWIFFQIWSFVAAGLHKHEQKYIYIYLPFSLILFFAGAALSFFFVFKPVLGFLFSFNAGMGIDPQPRIGDWLSFVMFLPLGFGISFQLPLVMLALNRIGLFDLSVYTSKWRAAILVIFVVSMFLTPADPISLLMMAVPLTLLYFLGIGLCMWMPRGRNPFGEEVYEP